MQPILQINIYSSAMSRIKFCMHSISQLFKIKETNKEKIILAIFTNKMLEKSWKTFISNSPIGFVLYVGEGDDYMERTHVAMNSKCEYSCRFDDDEFISYPLWDYMIDNIPILNDPTIAFLSPTFNCGIPSTDFFVNDALTSEEQSHLSTIFIRDGVPQSPWYSVDYSEIQRVISNMKVWDAHSYYENLNSYSGPCKGVHPIRFSYDANMFICKKTIECFNKFTEKNEYYTSKLSNIHNTHPFMFKTSTWKTALNTMYDRFDELSLNMYAFQNKLSTYIVRNGFAIHLGYGSITNISEIVNLYYARILNETI